jgi:hypothetical protein
MSSIIHEVCVFDATGARVKSIKQVIPISCDGIAGAPTSYIDGATITTSLPTLPAGHSYGSCTEIQCEQIQDCVGHMLDAAGFTYDDAGNRFRPGGTAGQALVSDGAGGATWGNVASYPAITSPDGSLTITGSGTGNVTITNPHVHSAALFSNAVLEANVVSSQPYGNGVPLAETFVDLVNPSTTHSAIAEVHSEHYAVALPTPGAVMNLLSQLDTTAGIAGGDVYAEDGNLSYTRGASSSRHRFYTLGPGATLRVYASTTAYHGGTPYNVQFILARINAKVQVVD